MKTELITTIEHGTDRVLKSDIEFSPSTGSYDWNVYVETRKGMRTILREGGAITEEIAISKSREIAQQYFPKERYG